MLVGIWAIADSHDLFWPFFPIAGWGVGLGMNAVGARAAQRHGYEKEVRRLEKAARGELAPKAPASRGSVPAAPRPDRSGGISAAKVVVMFTDVVDSTRLTMVIGDEDWTRVRRRYRDMLHECYRAYRGREVSSQGDGFLGRFDRPADAVQCAIAFQSKLQDQRETFGFAPAVRIGINAGEAIEEQGDILGSTVNLAARITSSAEPSEILVSEAVADTLDDRFQLQDGGLREMKGLNRTAHVLSVTWQ
jgi:class 3 adenylate cyclase